MDKEIIYDIRQFNRFYTKVLGVFNNQILDTDYRKNFLLLTKKGEELLDKINIQSDEQINQLFNGLTDSEIKEFVFQ